MTEHTGECGHHRWCHGACRPGATRWAARCRHRPATRSGPGLRSRRDKRTGPAAGSAGRNGPGARAWPASPGRPGLAAAARRGRGGHHRGRVRRLRPGPAGGTGQPPGRDRARGRAVAGRAVAAPGHRAVAQPPGRSPPGARRDGPDSQVNLYAAMPSLHVAWAAWCAAALVAATRGRRRHLAWLYPAATTVVVLATANHFLADAAAGLAVTALGLLAARAATRPGAAGPGPGGAGPAAASPALGPGAAARRRRPVIWRRL